MQNPTMFAQLRFKFHRVDAVTPGPGHIDATAKLIEALRDLTKSFGMLLALIKLPRIEQRHARIEQQRFDEFGRPDFGNATRIAADGIEVVVRHIIPETVSGAHGRRDDDRSLAGEHYSAPAKPAQT